MPDHPQLKHIIWRSAFLIGLVFTATDASATNVPPVPMQAYATLPAIADPKLSPDGEHLTYLAPINGRHHLVIDKLSSDPAHRPSIIGPSNAEIGWYEWVNDDRLVVVVHFTGTRHTERDINGNFVGKELQTVETRLISVSRDGSDMKVLLKPEREMVTQGINAGTVVSILPDDPEHILIATPRDGNGFPDVLRVNVYSGRRSTVVGASRNMMSYMADETGLVRIAVQHDDDKKMSTILIRDNDRDSFRTLHRRHMLDDPDMNILGFGDDPDTLYVASRHEGPRMAVYTMNARTGEMGPKLFDSPNFDIDGRILARNGKMIGIAYMADLPVQYFFDDDDQALLEQLDSAIPETAERILDRTPDGRHVLIASVGASMPTRYGLFDTVEKRLHFFGEAYPDIPTDALPPRKAVTYAARDGHAIPAYLTLPPGKDAKNLPFVVLPHGGPTARDTMEFDWLAGFVASRGYAVLQPNFRGSTGYGAPHMSAGFREWGGLMQDDVSDGVTWAVREGIADPARVCIVGWSYGGYSAMIGAAKTPELYRCAASIAGVADMVRLDRELSYIQFDDYNRALIGEDRKQLRAVSPIHSADAIQDPVLLIHGDADAVVPVEHSETMAKALAKAGKTHELIVVPGMSHWADRTADREAVLAALDRFLAAHLGD